MNQTITPTSLRIEGDIPISLAVQNGSRFLFISQAQRAYTHALHKYPAKFFPELPRWLIQRYSKIGDLVLDPFMGSGTTNLEAMLLGRPSVGVDIDLFSQWLARVKTTRLGKTQLLTAQTKLHKYLQAFSTATPALNLPSFPYRDQWFKPYVLQELAFIKTGVDQFKSQPKIHQFLCICFSSIIRATSEADNNCTRTVIRKKLNKQVRPGYALHLFEKRLNNNVLAMLKLQGKKIAKVNIPKNASATDMHAYKNETFDLVLTSPPYVNAVDYPRTHQLEMYWLGLVSGSLSDLKKKHVGTESVSVKDYNTLHKTGIKTADAVLKAIYEQDPRRAYIAYNFIADMTKNMAEVHRVLKKDAHYALVIGNNQIRGQRFESWRYLTERASKLGFRVECHFESVIINHFIKVPRPEQIQEDHILVLKKC